MHASSRVPFMTYASLRGIQRIRYELGREDRRQIGKMEE